MVLLVRRVWSIAGQLNIVGVLLLPDAAGALFRIPPLSLLVTSARDIRIVVRIRPTRMPPGPPFASIWARRCPCGPMPHDDVMPVMFATRIVLRTEIGGTAGSTVGTSPSVITFAAPADHLEAQVGIEW